mmetsp:Transcript_15369/g.41249  ORF Transcript_15369/g.41249 Transcript_15369/m.41249 type:complete len:881 (+) Transcript_15369:119-2761(+)|eukprot:CAMPEP_0185833640 /NCGR_PEP_ID=MMETSP1353-20130828/3290_1 /TAXON_ID=1077150 /ORGANISM="Erythrolobus australicus, Strain CCMP3124" /LENGTH=880 /DNA_ID=CAMNT_0028531955 /DNA_START=56 /DNA_END=2698 /DNA_ORIENTATION=+
MARSQASKSNGAAPSESHPSDASSPPESTRDNNTSAQTSWAAQQPSTKTHGWGESVRTKETPRERLAASGINRQRVLKCLGEAWRIKSEFTIPALDNLVTIVVIGPQSAGKTSFVERYLRLAFSVISAGIATKRPMELMTIPPDAGADLDENLVTFTASEADAEGNVDSNTTVEFVDVLDLAEWVKERNIVTEDRLVIKMTSGRFKSPRRVIDLPGLRTTDIDPEDKRVREVILKTALAHVSRPNSLLVFLGSITDQACNSTLVEFVKAKLVLDTIQARMLVVLSKCDLQLKHMTPDQLEDHIAEYEKAFGNAPVYMTGFTFPENVDTTKAENREEHYATANEREERELASYRTRSNVSGRQAAFWKNRAGFQCIVDDLESLIVLLDHSKLEKIAAAIAAEIQDAEKAVYLLSKQQQKMDSNLLKQETHRLVQEVATFTSQLSTDRMGYAVQSILSDSDIIKTEGMTFEAEEMEFMERLSEFELPNWSADFIDYVGSKKNSKGKAFEDHLLKMQKVVLANANLDDKNELLLPWSAKQRLEQWFALIVIEYVHLDVKDIQTIRNAIASSLEMPNFSSGLLRVKRLCDIYAAKMRKAAEYYVKRLAFLKDRCLLLALQHLLADFEKEQLIEALGGSTVVFAALRKGYRKELLKHSAHAFMAAMGDLDVIMQQLGEFHKNSYAVSALANAMKVDRAQICSAMEPYTKHAIDEVLKSLPEGYGGARKGVADALECIHAGTHHDCLPAFIKMLIERMIEKKMLNVDQKAQKVSLDKGSNITNVLEPVSDPNEMLGFVAAVLANVVPRFTSAIMTRGRMGAWASSELSPYDSDYNYAMMEQLERDCLNQAALEELRQKCARDLGKAELKLNMLRTASHEYHAAMRS